LKIALNPQSDRPKSQAKSDRLKYPHCHHIGDRPSINQQNQTAIAPNLSTKRSPKIFTLSPTSDRPSTNQHHQTAIAPNPQSDRLNIHTFHHASDRPSTIQQHQTAIAPNLSTKRSPKISTL